MADNTNLDILIRAVLDAKGFDDLQTRLKQTETGTKQAAAGASDFSGAIADVGGKLLAATGLMFGAAEAVAFLKDSFKAFVEEERILNQFDATNKILGGTLGRNTVANREWLESLELSSGRMKEEIIPSYQRLLAVTSDVNEAQRLTQIAALAAKAGLGEVGMITQSLIKYMETGQFSIRGGGAALKEMAGNAATTSEGLQNLEKRVRELAGSVENIGIESDRLNIRWQRTKEVLGGVGSAFLTLKSEVLEIVAKSLGGLAIAIEYVSGGFQKMQLIGKTAFEVIKSVASADLAGAEHAITELGGKLDFIEMDMRLKMAAIKVGIDAAWSDSEKRLNETTNKFKDHTDTQAKQLDTLKKKYEDLANNAVQLGMEEVQARLAVLRVYQQMANDPAVAKFPDLQAEANKRLVMSVNALGKAVAQEAEQEVAADKKRAKGFQDATDAEMAAEGKRITQWRKDKDLEVKEAIDTYKILHKQDSEYTVGFLQFLEQQLAAFAGTESEKRNLLRETNRVRVGLLMTEQQAANSALNSFITNAGEAFGIGKEIAYAEAIISTYAGAARALKDYQYPYSLIVAALTIASGLAQVAVIAQTNPQHGSFNAAGMSTGGGGTVGFDDPQNDFAAVAGGRKWARDMVNHYSAGAALGFSQGLMQAGGGSSISNVTNRGGDRHINITLNAGMGTDRVQLMRFVKNDLVPVLNKYDGRRTYQ